MNGIQQLRACSDIQTRQLMWVAIKNGKELGIFDAVSLSGSFRDRYTFDLKSSN